MTAHRRSIGFAGLDLKKLSGAGSINAHGFDEGGGKGLQVETAVDVQPFAPNQKRVSYISMNAAYSAGLATRGAALSL